MSYPVNDNNSSLNINKDYTWDQEDVAELFGCFRKVYEQFLGMTDELNSKYKDFITDETHTGNEADSTKNYAKNKQQKTNNDLRYLLQLFDSNQTDLLDSFKNELNEDDTAHYKLSRLEKIIEDFMLFNEDYRTVSKDINRLYNNVCSRAAVTGVEFTEPSSFSAVKNFDALTDESGKSGMLPKVRDDYNAFIEGHSGELNGSHTEALKNDIKALLKSMVEQMSVKIKDAELDKTKIELESKGFERYGNGRSSGAGVGKNMMFSMVRPNIANPVLAGMSGKSRESYLSRLSTSARFAAGAKPRFIAYASDPVNMSTGNYVSEETDIKIGGTYPLVFRRFYNSIFEQNDGGILGAGWSTDFGERMLRDGDDITISYSDGSKGTYKQITIRGKKFWEEIHGEPGVLSEEDDGFIVRMDSGSYVRFDKSGLVTEKGDHNGKTSEMIYESVDGIKRLAAVKTPGQGAFLLNYGINGRLESLKDHTGRTVSYSYEGECLTGVIYPDGTGKTYKYSDDGRISAVVNRRGITSIQNSYDDAGRITKQVFADGGCNVCEYDDGSQTVTLREANGNVLVYEHDEF
ncbi:YD repeat-containing protein, partial [Lachnospiraceae bacterium XPB1003]